MGLYPKSWMIYNGISNLFNLYVYIYMDDLGLSPFKIFKDALIISGDCELRIYNPTPKPLYIGCLIFPALDPSLACR